MITQRLAEVRSRIRAAASSSGRSETEIELIVVTKNHPAALVAQLIDLGESQFGENRDQEAAPKAASVATLRPQASPTWHFVGQLQSNKVKSAISYASVLHSLDRPSLLSELVKQLSKREQTLDCFIELNLTEDPGRGGVEPKNLKQFAESVLAHSEINLLGVMAVAGLGVDPRVDFERAVAASNDLRNLTPSSRFLSMGMSQDFEVAIELGATHIRVGSAITGPRSILT